MIFGELYPAMIGAAQALYMYIKSNEFTDEIMGKLCPIKHLAQDCAEDLFRSYLELRDKDEETLAFVCAYPEYERCDDNAWHGTVDGKINASRLIKRSLARTDRYSCGEKLMVMREGLTEFVGDAVANSVTACNYEYTLEDTYYEAKFTFLTQNGYGSPSSLIADGFGNAGDVLTNLANVFQQEQQGAAATFGVFARQGLDTLTRRSVENETGFSSRRSGETVVVNAANPRTQPNPIQPDRTFPLVEPEGRIIQTERLDVPTFDDSFVK